MKNKKISNEMKKINKARKLVRRKYRKKRKGFTLIELLAVILILGIIALIAIPTVSSVVKQSRIGANESTANSLVTAAEEQCTLAMLNGESYEGTYDLSNLYDLVKGNTDLDGYYKVDSNCKVEIIMQSNDLSNYCYKKKSDEDKVTYYEMSKEESCLLEQKTVTENSCFEYEENNGEITITGYKCGGVITGLENTDEESILTGRLKITSYTSTDYMDVIIPAYINDKPVTKIGQSAFSVGIMNADGSSSFDLSKKVIINSVVIPNTVKEIGDIAFSLNRINSLTLSYNIERIGKGVFSYNDLESLYLPNSLVEMGDDTFAVNERLSYVHFSEILTVIPKEAFSSCSITGTIIIPNNVVSIGMSAFATNNINKVIIGNNLTSLERGAFFNNNISEVIFNDRITNIGLDAFSQNNITSISLPNSLKTIGPYAFNYNKITGVLIIPDSVTSIGESAFHLNNISEVIIGKNVNTIGVGSFSLGEESNKITKIVNKTGKAFDWASVLWWGKDDERYVFETGTIPCEISGKKYTLEITK